MKRVCVIGNSHIVALKLGWDELNGEFADRIEPIFFGASGGKLAALQIRGGALIATNEEVRNKIAQTSGGEETIEVDDYDTFIITGLGYKFLRVMVALLSRYLTPAYATTSDEISYVSDACLHEATKALLAKSMAVDIAVMINSIKKAHVILVPQPLPSELILESGQGRAFRAFIDNGDAGKAYKLFRSASVELLRERNVIFFEQPEETKYCEFLTRHDFSKGSVRLSAGFKNTHPDTDFGHMNGSFGAAIWRKLLTSNHI